MHPVVERGAEKRITWLGVVAGVLATAVVAALFVYPWSDDTTGNGGRGVVIFFAAFCTFVVVGFLAGCCLQVENRRKSQIVAGAVVLALLGPLVAGAVGYVHRDEHRYMLAMLDVHKRYRSAIPHEFGEPYIYVRATDLGTVCSVEYGKKGHPNDFCTSIDLSLPKGHQVEGGYRAHPRPDYVTTRGPGLPYGCWGFERREGTCDY